MWDECLEALHLAGDKSSSNTVRKNKATNKPGSSNTNRELAMLVRELKLQLQPTSFTCCMNCINGM
jgi:hypothetical protein